VNILLQKLFTAEEIMAHSVSGKAENPKPKSDSVRLELLKKLCTEKTNEATPLQGVWKRGEMHRHLDNFVCSVILQGRRPLLCFGDVTIPEGRILTITLQKRRLQIV